MKTHPVGWPAFSNWWFDGKLPSSSWCTTISWSSSSSTTSWASSIATCWWSTPTTGSGLSWSVFTPGGTWTKYLSTFLLVSMSSRSDLRPHRCLSSSHLCCPGCNQVVEHVHNVALSGQDRSQAHQLLSGQSMRRCFVDIFDKFPYLGSLSKEFKANCDALCKPINYSCLQTCLKEGILFSQPQLNYRLSGLSLTTEKYLLSTI